MSPLRMSNIHASETTMFLIFALLSGSLLLQAKDPASDACQLLTASQVAKVLGQPFGQPAKTTAPPAPYDRVMGTECTYRTGNGTQLRFTLYVDPSVAIAKAVLTKLSALYGTTKSVAGNWDAAFFDPNHIFDEQKGGLGIYIAYRAIPVRKGRERYYLNLRPIGADAAKAENQLQELATWVATQLLAKSMIAIVRSNLEN